MKRVETCEANPHEALAVNTVGTRVVARAALNAGVTRAVFLSTDKAVAPNTLYGATKLAAERLWTQSNVYAAGTETRFSATRYGNVLGSRGSVLGTWRQQYAERKPLTVTDERCTRFWMTMQQAVGLVALAFREMRGGEVFVPKIGAAPLLDLARAVVEVNGTYAPGHVNTGLRPGEKLHESLVGEDESRGCYDHGTHYRIEPDRSWGDAVPNVLARRMVADGFTYRSDNTQRLTVEQLRRMIG
jgi:UDP-N-acetylglucosamine 4,6-dehydratase